MKIIFLEILNLTRAKLSENSERRTYNSKWNRGGHTIEFWFILMNKEAFRYL